MRISSGLALATIGATIALSGAGTTSAAQPMRHTGTVEHVDAKARTLVIREFGANARASDFRIHLAPNARIVRSERNPQAADVQHEFTDTPIALSAIKHGDFVVINVAGHGAHALGESVMVTLPVGG